MRKSNKDASDSSDGSNDIIVDKVKPRSQSKSRSGSSRSKSSKSSKSTSRSTSPPLTLQLTPSYSSPITSPRSGLSGLRGSSNLRISNVPSNPVIKKKSSGIIINAGNRDQVIKMLEQINQDSTRLKMNLRRAYDRINTMNEEGITHLEQGNTNEYRKIEKKIQKEVDNLAGDLREVDRLSFEMDNLVNAFIDLDD